MKNIITIILRSCKWTIYQDELSEIKLEDEYYYEVDISDLKMNKKI